MLRRGRRSGFGSTGRSVRRSVTRGRTMVGDSGFGAPGRCRAACHAHGVGYTLSIRVVTSFNGIC